jgi:hypothetical protein
VTRPQPVRANLGAGLELQRAAVEGLIIKFGEREVFVLAFDDVDGFHRS